MSEGVGVDAIPDRHQLPAGNALQAAPAHAIKGDADDLTRETCGESVEGAVAAARIDGLAVARLHDGAGAGKPGRRPAVDERVVVVRVDDVDPVRPEPT